MGRAADYRVQEYGFYYLQSRYYDPEVGRFLNADAFTSTGQGILGNNMFAYCLNSPIAFIDPSGLCTYIGYQPWLSPNGQYIDCNNMHCPTSNRYLRGTLTFGSCYSATVFVGISCAYAISIDLHGNIEIQKSVSVPNKRETTTIGIFGTAANAPFVQITNKGDVSELQGISTYVGAGFSACSIDLVSAAPAADWDAKACGVQITFAKNAIIDPHIAQTNTETIVRFKWKDVFEWVKGLFT